MQHLLAQGLADLGLEDNSSLGQNLWRYIELLSQWNQSYNLIADSDNATIINRHVLDSLSVLPFIQGDYCLDVGTGAGLPGMILALAQTQKQWVLLDSNQKKLRFLRHVVIALELNNVELVHARIEAFQTTTTFDTVICRAFAPLAGLLDKTAHLLTAKNQLLAMKGAKVHVELQTVQQLPLLFKVQELALVDKARSATLLQITKPHLIVDR